MPTFVFIAVCVFGADWATKALVRHHMTLGQEIPLLPFFSLTHVENTGIAFGLFPNNNSFFIGVGIILTVVIVWMAIRSYPQEKYLTYIFALIVGGAWGNLIDRIRFGRVTDFLDFYVGNHHWPAFNIADSSICVGAVLMFVMGIYLEHRSKKEA